MYNSEAGGGVNVQERANPRIWVENRWLNPMYQNDDPGGARWAMLRWKIKNSSFKGQGGTLLDPKISEAEAEKLLAWATQWNLVSKPDPFPKRERGETR